MNVKNFLSKRPDHHEDDRA